MNTFLLKFCFRPKDDVLCWILGAAWKLMGESGLFLCQFSTTTTFPVAIIAFYRVINE
jgi:hypothetical protein